MVPESIRKIKRPLNTIVQAAKNPNVYMTIKRIGCKYVDGRRIPVNGPVTGHIIDGKYIEKQASKKKRMCQDENDSPRSHEDRSPRNAKQQTNKTVPRRAVSIRAGEISLSKSCPTGRIWASSERAEFVLFGELASSWHRNCYVISLT